MNNRISTTVKIETELYDELKMFGIRHKFTLQHFVEKCIHKYVHDEEFRKHINNFSIPPKIDSI